VTAPRPGVGELKQYLDELEADESKVLERWFYTDWLRTRQTRREQAAELAEWRRRSSGAAAAAAAVAAAGAEAAAAAALGSAPGAPVQRPGAEGGQGLGQGGAAREAHPEPVPAAEDPSKMPSFWSLDNPIVLTFAVLAMVAALSVLLARVQALSALQ
jgi:hypothetical protein